MADWEYHQDERDHAASIGLLWIVVITLVAAGIIVAFG